MPILDGRPIAVDADIRDLIPAPRPAPAPTTSRTDHPRTSAGVHELCTYPALGFDIAVVRHVDAVTQILGYAREGRSRQVHLCNQYTLTLAQRDEELARALRTADLNLPDGAPIAWLGRGAGTAGPVRGPALTADVFAGGVARDGRRGVRHYLYGGRTGVADEMAGELRRRNPGVEIVGTETPPFHRLTAAEVRAVADRINRSGADIAWIGLGTPRQDHLVAALGPLVDATLVPVGAAFDYLAGRVVEAPSFVHGTGFEWLYRLLREPRRLWRRYLVDGLRFGYYVVADTRPFSAVLPRRRSHGTSDRSN